MIEVIYCVLAITLLPVVSYFVVKLGTLGYLRARQLFEETDHESTRP